MNPLNTTFTLDNHNFTQVKRSDKAAMYRRETLDGQFVSFEVFAIMTKDGAEVYPNQTAMNRWAYCPISEDRANKWYDRFNNGEVVIPQIDPVTGEALETADNRNLDDLPEVAVDTTVPTPAAAPVVDDPTAPEAPTPEVTPTADGGAIVTVTKVSKTKVLPTYNFPTTATWLRDDFAELNGMDHHPAHSDSYGPLMALIKAGKVVEVKKEKVGKGRPRSFYAVVTQPDSTPVVAAPATV